MIIGTRPNQIISIVAGKIRVRETLTLREEIERIDPIEGNLMSDFELDQDGNSRCKVCGADSYGDFCN